MVQPGRGPPNATSAWLFIGSNATYLQTASAIIDFSGISATYNSTFWYISEDSYNTTWGAYLASMLLCEPVMNFSIANVRYSPLNNTLSVMPEVLDLPSVGNIDFFSATNALAQCLLDATSMQQAPLTYLGHDTAVSALSTQLFLQPINHADGKLHLLSASNISSSIGQYFSIATKAWSDGYRAPGKFSTKVVDAVKGEERLALVASVPFTIIAGVLVVLVLGFTVVQLKVRQGTPLGIGSLEQVLGSIQMGDMSLVTSPLQALRE